MLFSAIRYIAPVQINVFIGSAKYPWQQRWTKVSRFFPFSFVATLFRIEANSQTNCYCDQLSSVNLFFLNYSQPPSNVWLSPPVSTLALFENRPRCLSATHICRSGGSDFNLFLVCSACDNVVERQAMVPHMKPKYINSHWQTPFSHALWTYFL